MAAERGTYRPIPAVLLDGPDFQQLPERARFAFLALKINFGPSGIEVQYPQALAATVAAQTGMPYQAALDAVGPAGVLEGMGWLEWEQNVVWIKGQLRYDPNMKPSDPKHRKSIQQHLMGLPRLDICARFMLEHTDWFAFDELSTEEGLDARERANLTALRWACEGPKKALPTTDNREPKTEDREPNLPRKKRGGDGPPPWSARAVEAWTDRYGGTAPAGRIGAALKPLVERYGADEVLHVWARYLAGKDVEYASPQDFAQKYGPWRDQRLKAQGGKATPQLFDYSDATVEFKGFTA